MKVKLIAILLINYYQKHLIYNNMLNIGSTNPMLASIIILTAPDFISFVLIYCI